MPRGGIRPNAGRKKGTIAKPMVPLSLREEATTAFHAAFKRKLQQLIETTVGLVTGPEPDPRMLQYVWDRILGKQAQQVDLGAGQGIAGVEVTYRIIAQPKSDA